MNQIFQYFPKAKINIGLKITGKRSDGYHEIESLFLPIIEITDELIIIPRAKGGLFLDCSGIEIEGKNILLRTWEVFTEDYGHAPSLELHLIKRIPTGAGLGGGSSDAADFLKYLASASPAPISRNDLLKSAEKIGADVPFFLNSKPAFVSGIGERLTPLKKALPELHFVIVWPGIKIPTVWAFQAYDEFYDNKITDSSPQNNLTKDGVDARDFFSNAVCKLAEIDLPQNDLEAPVFEKYPQLSDLKKEFLRLGAKAASMSGSGSTIYGIFADFDSAFSAIKELHKNYPYVYYSFT